MIRGILGRTLKFVHDPTVHQAKEKHHDLRRATRRRRGRHQQTGPQCRQDAGRFRVRALTRDPSSPQARELARLGADVVVAPLEPGHDDEWLAALTGARNAFLVTPPTAPENSREYELGCRLADAALRAGVEHVVFSTLENVDDISGGTLFAPHFTDKARIADHIRTHLRDAGLLLHQPAGILRAARRR